MPHRFFINIIINKKNISRTVYLKKYTIDIEKFTVDKEIILDKMNYDSPKNDSMLH